MDILLMMKFPSTKRAMETKNLYLNHRQAKIKKPIFRNWEQRSKSYILTTFQVHVKQIPDYLRKITISLFIEILYTVHSIAQERK